jgi:hypothetical protein
MVLFSFVCWFAHRGHRGHRGQRAEAETADALLEQPDVEVDEQAKRKACEPQVGNDLALRDEQQVLHRLDFDDHKVIDDQVEAVTAVQAESLVDNGDSLALNLVPLGEQFVLKATLVRGLQQSRAQKLMNLDGAPMTAREIRFKAPSLPPLSSVSLC